MTATYESLLSDAYLRAIFSVEFSSFTGSQRELDLIQRLDNWSTKQFQKETSAEGAFTSTFLEETWGFVPSGKQAAGSGFTSFPKYPIAGAGQGGGTGEADVALGYFGRSDVPATPQVLCEFKDVRSNLDAPQKRKGNNRSPVKQCADYLREAMKPLYGNEAIQPAWGVVTDMNEFRLYWRNTMPSQYQRFIIKKSTTDEGISLLEKSEEGSFQRFLFLKLLHADNLLTLGGPSPLLKLLKDQRYQEKEIENLFYREYRAYREHLVKVLINNNQSFKGTKGRLVRLAQKLIDRCIFIMFCEDMGEQLSFPPNALRDYLAELSKSSTFEPDENDAWNKLKELFHAMNEGKKFRSRILNKFNGGLFAVDSDLEGLSIPNEVFCAKLQGENDTTLSDHKLSLLYFAGSYNFGTVKRNGKAITLFTLGRIFEQSITELEALEAAADEKESLTVISKRKRDGVYYTPEWVVERVVAETIGHRLDDIRRDCGWSFEIEGDEDYIREQLKLSPSKRSVQFKRHVEAVRKFRDELESFTVLDPACGSGAFLIHTLEYLLRERRRVERELSLVTKNAELFEFKTDDAVRSILSRNIFGVDINPASVEIARLALWLHTARSNQPLTKLDTNILTGNSLVAPDVYTFKNDLLGAPETKRETINAFDFRAAFPSIFNSKRPGGAGFDCVVGNPPYVKLQNFKRVYPDTAEYLRGAPGPKGEKLYRSCQTGVFDLYLPFIEHGLTLLNDRGRLGFIAPSVWRFNEYGAGLRGLIKNKRALDRWIDFGSFQVFNEATTYTALQFYSNTPSGHIQIALAPDGVLASIPDWDDANWRIEYEELSSTEPWIFASRPTLNLIKKLRENCLRLGDRKVTESISQGLISGAFEIFGNERVSAGLYRSKVDKVEETVPLEDQIMKQLISAADIDRFIVHTPALSILFPYSFDHGRPVLMVEKQMTSTYPKAWSHLRKHEALLRKRDAGQFAIDGDEHDRWYAYSRNQNLDKQSSAKIVIAGTGVCIEAALDEEGRYAANDKRVYSVFPTDPSDLKFLSGILNCRVTTFVFRHIARPKDNGYFDIETQFLSPLPIPKATKEQKEEVAACVDKLVKSHKEYASVLDDLNHRLAACIVQEQSVQWLWPAKIQTLDAMKLQAPAGMGTRAKTAWARAEQNEQIKNQTELLAERLKPNTSLSVTLEKGELRVLCGGEVLIDSLFMDEADGRLIEIGWRHFLRTNGAADSESLVRGLCRLYTTDNKALLKQLAELDIRASALEEEISSEEASLNQLAYELYDLTAAEIALVESSFQS